MDQVIETSEDVPAGWAEVDTSSNADLLPAVRGIVMPAAWPDTLSRLMELASVMGGSQPAWIDLDGPLTEGEAAHDALLADVSCASLA